MSRFLVAVRTTRLAAPWKEPGMTRCAVVSLATLLVVGFAGTMAGCKDSAIGRPCVINVDAGAKVAIIEPQALECPSRLCVHPPAEGSPRTPVVNLCTDSCEGDGDCEGMTDPKSDKLCHSGFICMVVLETGPLCCNKYCVCKDFVEVPEGGLRDPAGCDPSIKANTCCNLSGRRGSPDYPLCK
jgi:hypothetical protein